MFLWYCFYLLYLPIKRKVRDQQMSTDKNTHNGGKTGHKNVSICLKVNKVNGFRVKAVKSMVDSAKGNG